MKIYDSNRSGIMQYVHDIEEYAARKNTRGDGWISSFTLDLLEAKWAPFNDADFIKALLSIPAYVIARILLFDSEGYMHAIDKVRERMHT